jgi:hypothetical protein
MTTKTHYRKAFDSPYLSSADIVEPIVLTISHVMLEPDRTKKTKDVFNTAHFADKEIRPGEKLKPLILNAGNSKTMKAITDSPFIEDWQNVKVTIFVDPNVRFGKETVEGLRIRPAKTTKIQLTPDNVVMWKNAQTAYRRDGNLISVLQRVDMSDEHQMLLIESSYVGAELNPALEEEDEP